MVSRGGTPDPDDSHVSKVVKWLMFMFNFFFWVIGGVFIGIGTWAYLEKRRYDYGKVDTDGNPDEWELYDLIFDLTIICMGMGIVLFAIAFPGCLGALRENIVLLKAFMYILGGLMALEICMALLAFIFSDELKRKISSILQDQGIVRYRDDPDLRNFVDFVQERFQCCGVETGDYIYGFQAWDLNPYFNCTPSNPSPERCAVPHSCCKMPDDIVASIKNTMCGHNINTADPNVIAVGKKIYTSGCVKAMVKKAKDNLFLMGGAALSFTVPQILGIFMARYLINYVEDRKALW